jgi:hypothetical protein
MAALHLGHRKRLPAELSGALKLDEQLGHVMTVGMTKPWW